MANTEVCIIRTGKYVPLSLLQFFRPLSLRFEESLSLPVSGVHGLIIQELCVKRLSGTLIGALNPQLTEPLQELLSGTLKDGP